MELKHIDIAKLCISSANMRAKGKPDLSHILPSIRARGVLVPLIVRPAEAEDRFEIVAGKRRYHAALAVAEEGGGEDSLPCAIMAAGDDAAALEASLIENVARLDPDEVTLWETFTRLVREGRSPEDIALTFGLTELQVKRTLALGNLLPRIRGLYRKGDIDVATVRHLTLASTARQRDWLALADDPEARCPTGHSLKAWLFGGASVPVSAALFDMTEYPGEVISDLFGDERYFADTSLFWAAQNAAIEAKAEGYREAGWSEVVVLPTGETFHSWEHERCPKRKGGKVFLAVSARGEVTVHEGFISTKEARRRERGEVSQDEKPVRPEVSAPIQNYVDLHRHAAVRADLIGQPSAALRLMVAHAIVGSSLWSVRIEDQRATSDAIAESVENCASEARFDEKRRAVLALLGFDPEAPTVTRGYDGEHGIAGLFVRLLQLPDPAVRDVAAIVMGETLEAGSPLVELLGLLLGTNMAKVWQTDDALLDLVRDREVIGCVLADVAGVLKVILYGSYARGGWVDEPHTAKGYQSDFDLLVIVNHEKLTDRIEYWSTAEDRLNRELAITKTLRTPVNFIVHTTAEVNAGLSEGRYFFMDIARDGIALYQSDPADLPEPQPKTPAQALAMAREYFEEWLPSANTRKRFGTHSTPRQVAEYVVEQLDLGRFDPAQISIFEPFAGAGTFLVAALRHLRDQLPSNLGGEERHAFLVPRIAGAEIDSFACEVATLSLILADYPNANGWKIQPRDLFKDDVLREVVAGIPATARGMARPSRALQVSIRRYRLRG